PVKSQGPALLGQVCTTVPLPPPTHAVWPVLVAMANKRLNETVGFSDMGTGESVFALRGDCEPGAFCDTAASGATKGKGVCVEQLPNYHTCSSFFQCISLRCSQEHALVKREEEVEEEFVQDVEIGGNHVESVSSSFSSSSSSYPRQPSQPRHNKHLSSFTKRRVGSICVPLSHESPGSGTGGGSGGNRGGGAAPDLNSGDSVHHEIPGWAAAIIGGVLLVCVLAGLVFTRRRRLKQQKKRASLARQTLIRGGTSGGRERERSMSVTSGFEIEKHAEAELGYHAHPATPATTTTQEVAGRTVFSRWFGASKKSARRLSLPRGDSVGTKDRRQSVSTVTSYRSNHSASGALDSAYSGGVSFEGYGRYDATGVPSGHSSRRASSQSNAPRRASAPAIPQITTTLSETHRQIPSVSRSETFSGVSFGHKRRSTDVSPAPAPVLLTRFQEGETPHETMTPSDTDSRLSTPQPNSSSGASSPRSISTRMSHSPNNLSVPGSPISPISPISPLMGTVGTSRLSSRSSYRHAST
ncbi:hypothetical protein BG000_000344, partial [Podila horticola]